MKHMHAILDVRVYVACCAHVLRARDASCMALDTHTHACERAPAMHNAPLGTRFQHSHHVHVRSYERVRARASACASADECMLVRA